MENCIVRSVKRIIKFIVIVALLILLIIAGSKIFDYYHIGYTIKNMNVEVDVTSKKQYKVTEVIDAHFHAEKPGIERLISQEVTDNNFTITDISVDGEKFKTSTDKYKGVTIKIGEFNKKISGDKKYVIHYTLTHYGYDQDDKKFNVNVLENNRDVKVENFTADVKFPKGFIPAETTAQRYKIDTGYKYMYNKDKSDIKCDVKDNDISLKTDSPVDNNMGICVKAVLNNSFEKSLSYKNNDNELFLGGNYKEKEYTGDGYMNTKIKFFIDNYSLGIIGFVVLVFIGICVENARQKQIEREREEYLRRKRMHTGFLEDILRNWSDCC